MRIAFCAYLHGFGGAERQIITLANEMSKRGHSVYLLSLAAHNPSYQIEPKVNYIKLIENYRSKSKLSKILQRYLLLRKELIRIVPDVTIHFWFQSAYLTSLMRKKVYKRLIYSERGDPGDKEYSGLMYLIRKLTFLKVDSFIFQSYAAMKYFPIRIQNRSIVINNAVLIKKQFINTWIGDQKILVSVGRLSPQKNFNLLIQAFNTISNDFPDYNLHIYGEGELQQKLQALINSLGLQRRVYLLGAIETDKLHSRLKHYKMFILPSDYEGMPNSLIEAMAIGLPCISTNYHPLDAVRDIIVNGENGIITKAGNIDDLANAIKELLADKVKQETISKNAIRKVREFDYVCVYDKWESFINFDNKLDYFNHKYE